VNGLAVASNGERNPLPAGTAVVDDLPNAGVKEIQLEGCHNPIANRRRHRLTPSCPFRMSLNKIDELFSVRGKVAVMQDD
jgi:hypothetical protein